MISASRVTVATTPTALTANDADGSSVLIRIPSGGVSVDLGPSNVVAGAGVALGSGESITLDLAVGENLYGIVASGTQVVHVLTTRL